ncbi:MAG: hypothetical protein LBM27_03310 [Lactobacillaceae bacterium]|jgi:hypothetical protein|nr:hypothetical protein [Lactobacillaceae bacterium]
MTIDWENFTYDSDYYADKIWKKPLPGNITSVDDLRLAVTAVYTSDADTSLAVLDTKRNRALVYENDGRYDDGQPDVFVEVAEERFANTKIKRRFFGGNIEYHEIGIAFYNGEDVDEENKKMKMTTFKSF